jgi:hypothetical protein
MLFLRARLTVHSSRRRFAARLNSGVRRLHALVKQLTPLSLLLILLDEPRFT